MQPESDVVRYGESLVPDVERIDTSSVAAGQEGYVPPTPVQVQPAVQSTIDGLESSSRVTQLMTKPQATVLESIGASFNDTSIANLVQLANKPKFSKAAPGTYDPVQYVNNLPIQLSEEERSFMLDHGSLEEGKWKYQKLQDDRVMRQAMGDNPVFAALPQLFDPGMLALDAASIGVAKVARMGRLAAGATAAGIQTGFVAGVRAQVTPVSTGEIVANAVFNGVGVAVAHTPTGRTVQLDPEYPARELQGHTNTVAAVQRNLVLNNPDTGKLPKLAHIADDIEPATVLAGKVRDSLRGTPFEELASRIANAPELASIRVSTAERHAVKGANGFFRYGADVEGGNNLLWLRQGTDVGTPLHELTHAVLQLRIQAKPELLREVQALRKALFNPGEGGALSTLLNSAAKAELRGKPLSADEGAAVFFSKMARLSDSEFIAYVYTSPTFRGLLDKLQVQAGGRVAKAVPAASEAKRSVLDKVLDFFKRVLGLEGNAARQLDAKLHGRTASLDYSTLPEALKPLDEQLKRIMRDAFDNPEYEFGAAVHNSLRAESFQEAAAIIERDPNLALKIGKGVEWSLHRKLGRFDKRAADLLVDDPINRGTLSADGYKQAARRGWSRLQFQYEDKFLQVLADRGYGWKERVLGWGEGLQAYNKLQSDLRMELALRQDAERVGGRYRGTDTAVAELADMYNAPAAAALREAKAAGVRGAEAVQESSGYFHRRWSFTAIEDVQKRLIQLGKTQDEAVQEVQGLLQRSIRAANPDWDDSLVKSVGAAMYERARAKSLFEDSEYSGHMGVESVIEVRSMLERIGVAHKDMERVLEFMVGKVDEAGKVSSLKKRVEMDASQSIQLSDGTKITYLDLLDNNMNTILDAYLDNMGGRVGLAKVGLEDSSALSKLKQEGMAAQGTQDARNQYNDLFDNTVKHLLGMPVGEALHPIMRASSAVTQMVGLTWSALYQLTEMAVPAMRYGMLKTWRYSLANMPGLKGMYGELLKDQDMATSLVNVLKDYSAQDYRLRPILQRFEDGFEYSPSSQVLTTLQQARQLVPYINGMKYVHHWSAKVSANLVVDTLVRATRGDAKAAEILSSYGLKRHYIEKIAHEVNLHKYDVSKWSDEVFSEVRPLFVRMMDDAVLRARAGELPTYAQFSTLGKFLFTYRNFVLASHNKVLAGTLGNEGFAGMGLLLMHQLPLAVLTTHAQQAIQNKELPEGELLYKALAQMGAWGLASELFGIVSGQRNEFGAPGMIGIDRMVGLVGAASQGNLDAQKLLNAMPLIAVSPFTKALQHLKE